MRKQSTTILAQDFFERPVLDVAPELIGKFLVCETGAFCITEVEAYDGPDDQACHGRFGKTARTASMFGPAGHWYLYFVYGMYWMLNVVTGGEGYPAAVLIRGVEGCIGPGKLTRELEIDGRFNGLPLHPTTQLWIEDRGVTISQDSIERLPRVGIDYAGEWAQKPYRFRWKTSIDGQRRTDNE